MTKKTKISKRTIEKNLAEPLFNLSSGATVNISLWKLISQPLKMTANNWQNIFLIGVPVAILLTICSILLKRPFICSVNQESLFGLSLCSDTMVNYYADTLIRFFLLAFFAAKWYRFSILKQPYTPKNIFYIRAEDAKGIGMITLFTLANLSPLIGLIILFMRVPNPNWKIELAFFTSVAWIFLIPIIAIRFYSLIAFAFEKQKLPSIKKVWGNTCNNTLKLILGTSVIVFLALFVFMQYYAFIRGLADLNYLIAISTEFEYNIFVVLFVGCCINLCKVQKNLLFEGE